MKHDNNIICVIAQAFYGNRTATQVKRENVDRFILGYLNPDLPLMGEELDRSFIKIPGTDRY